VPFRFLPHLLALSVLAGPLRGSFPDRRVVDRVEVGQPSSEARHGYEGMDAVLGHVNGFAYRQTRQWLHFALTTYDDTDVTVECTFIGTDGETSARAFDLVVQDSLIASPTLRLAAGADSTLSFSIPFSLTKGHSSIIVFVRARDGLTPALRELRTVQDHYETVLVSTPSGVAR